MLYHIPYLTQIFYRLKNVWPGSNIVRFTFIFCDFVFLFKQWPRPPYHRVAHRDGQKPLWPMAAVVVVVKVALSLRQLLQSRTPPDQPPLRFLGVDTARAFCLRGISDQAPTEDYIYFVKVLIGRDSKFRAWSGGGLIGTANRYLAVGSTNPFPAVATGFEAIWKAKMLQRTMFLYCTCLHEFWKSRLHYMHIDIALPLEKDFQQQILFSFHRHQSFDPQTKRKSGMCSWHIPSSITI